MSLGWATLRQPIHRRVPVRWSTVLMLMAFLGLGALYLDVRTETPTKVVVGVSTATTTPRSTTTPATTTTSAPSETSQAPTRSSTTSTSVSAPTSTAAPSSSTTVVQGASSTTTP